MAIPSRLQEYIAWFNETPGYWTFTKARSVRPQIIQEIVEYHDVLRRLFVANRQDWTPLSQQEFANAIKPGSGAAWAREVKTLFNLLGSAWVEANDEIKLTEVGWEILRSSNPLPLLEHQVRKYQIGNPQTRPNLTSDINVVPHYVILEFLVNDYPNPVLKEEFILFISRIHSHEQIPEFQSLLREFRTLSTADKSALLLSLDPTQRGKIERDFSYAANFLTLPRYLEYGKARVSISALNEAERVLAWYHQGHDTYIGFQSLKDWFSHYGRLDTTANPLLAADYYRSIGLTEEATLAYKKAIDKGIAPLSDSPEAYRCRVNGEAALESWLADNLQRLEVGLEFVGRQFETNDAGRIDILAKDAKSNYVVIELKRDKASDVALGQLLRYLGWVRMHLGNGNSVRGFVVGDEIDDRMVYAILSSEAVESLCKLKQYKDLGVKLVIERSADNCLAWVEELNS